MSTPNPALAEKRREMLAFVRDTINHLVEHHFPSSTPNRNNDTEYAFGIDAHPVDDMSSVRVFAPVRGHEDMYPTFLHSSYNLTPADITQDHSLRSNDGAHDELRRDLNRLITGNPDGEKIPVVAMKDEKGTPTSRSEMGRVSVSLSEEHPEGALSIIVYGPLVELHDRMQANLAREGNADLRMHAPKAGRRAGK